VRSPMDNVRGPLGGLSIHTIRNRIVHRGDHIAEDAVFIVCLRRRPCAQGSRNSAPGLRVRSSNVAVTPGSPQTIHSDEYSGEQSIPIVSRAPAPSNFHQIQ
jgi:hypothetical protein